MDLDTFLTTLYVVVDDWYQDQVIAHKPVRGGARERMTDSEVLTLMVAAQWRQGVPWQSERSLIRYMHAHGRVWFPYLLGISAFNRRGRQLCGVLAALQRAVAAWLQPQADYEVMDGLPLPNCTVAHALRQPSHWLMHSNRGHGGNYGGWFHGQRWWVSVTPLGLITGWIVAEAAIQERWVLEAFLSARSGDGELYGPPPDPRAAHNKRAAPPSGFVGGYFAVGDWQSTYLADRGLNGERWSVHWRETFDVAVITVPPANAATYSHWTPADCHWLASKRQPIETVYALMTEVFGIKRVNAHSQWGQYTRLAAKAAAYNLGLFINHLLQRPLGALATLIC